MPVEFTLDLTDGEISKERDLTPRGMFRSVRLREWIQEVPALHPREIKTQ